METLKATPRKIEYALKKDAYENKYWQTGHILAGVDEVGRGCSAGPVVAGAVILYPYRSHPLLQDSKKLSEKHLKDAYEWIIANSWHAIGICSHRIIDHHNIYKATQIAMNRALHQLYSQIQQNLDLVVVDAMPLSIPQFCGDMHYFTQGESKSLSIAAASIFAKVTRDSIMVNMAPNFPVYGLERHKGYETLFHKKGIAQVGPAVIHRKSFSNIAKAIKETQNCLF
jgi:ribonuclease HII